MSKIDIHHLTKKQRKQMHGWLRAIIQLLYFLFLPSAYTAAFAGVKYIFTQLGAGEKIGLTSFVSVLIVLCLYTIVFGRFFCGFGGFGPTDAFGSMSDSAKCVAMADMLLGRLELFTILVMLHPQFWEGYFIKKQSAKRYRIL